VGKPHDAHAMVVGGFIVLKHSLAALLKLAGINLLGIHSHSVGKGEAVF